MNTPGTYSLLELNQYIRRVISLNFDEPIWIECEIGQASHSRGHWYLDLIQKDENNIVAQCQAALWANVYFYLKRKSRIPPEDILRQGMSVKIKVNVDYHERYGLKLIIEDIDSSFTIGVLEMQRQAILKELKDKNLIRKNAERHLPIVVQRLAVISSDRAAGWKDFVTHIEDNAYGYDISITLFESAMQGQQVEAEMLSGLQQIENQLQQFDAIAIIRGGGGRTDLAAFDNLALAVRIARFPIPVLIGIGHEIDQSVLDLVAYQSLKTPTAVADFIVEHNAGFESRLEALSDQIQDEVKQRIRDEHDRIMDLVHGIQAGIKGRLMMERQRLAFAHQSMIQSGKQMLRLQRNRLEHLHTLLQAIDPDQVLARGYTITSSHGKTITLKTQVQSGMEIQTTFRDGSIKSIVE
jgi:exodeoxyribonuclease VII large subunit